MRITISLDDQLARQARRVAAAQGISMSAFIAQTLDTAIRRREPSQQLPFHLVTVSGVRRRAGVDLDQPRALDARDDEGLLVPGETLRRP